MTLRKSALDSLQVPRPCPVGWDEMVGSEQVRYCGACRKNVYNLSEMTRQQAERLVAASHGNLCARFVRLPDGTVATEEPDFRLGLLDRRASPVAAAVVTAVLSVGPAAATLPRNSSSPSGWSCSVAQDGTTFRQSAEGGAAASLAGTVKGDDGAPIAGAKVTLTSLDTGNSIVATAATSGLFKFSNVAEGSYKIGVEADGFERTSFSGVELVAGRSHQTDIMLKAVRQQFVTMGAFAMPPQPLRTLYENAALIVVGRPLESSTVERDDYSRLIKTSVEVSETLKGSPGKSTISVYHDERSEAKDPFADGEPILLFLKHRESKGIFKKSMYEPLDSAMGVKKLSDSELASYTNSIKSLQATLQGDRPCRNELADWLVRTIEDPATRWEGAIDLHWNRADPVFQDCGGEEPVTEKKAIDVVSPGEPIFGPSQNEPSCPVVRIADMLTQSQKDRIVSVVLGLDKISDADELLIRVAAGWKDPRMVPFLLSKIEQMPEVPNLTTASLALALSDLLDDTQITEAARSLEAAAYKSSLPAAAEETEEESADESEDAEPVAAGVSQNPGELLRQFITQVKAKIERESRNASAAPSGR